MPRQEAFSDDDILRAIREAARRCGEPLSHARSDAVAREVHAPSSARVVQRFGTWRRACQAAGVAVGATVREYHPRWGREQVTAAVAGYLAEEGSLGTYADYEHWARQSPDRPSGATVRNVMGGWSAAKAAAQS